MMRVANDFDVRCNRCGRIVYFYADEFDEYTTCAYERNMGTEIEFDFPCEKDCKCGNSILVHVMGYEYPEGAFNYTSVECDGGEFLLKPSAEMDYEFDLDYADYVAQEYLSVEDVLARRRVEIQNMSDRDFEFFVADILRDMGYSVKVTQQTRDGGSDIIATKDNPIPFTMLVECKHWSGSVGVSVVRSLYGVQAAKRANKSILVTSSRFKPDARAFAEDQQDLMSLWDMEDLLRLTDT